MGCHVLTNLRAMRVQILTDPGAMSVQILAELGAVGAQVLAHIVAESVDIRPGCWFRRGRACHVQMLAQTCYAVERVIAYSRASARASQLASMMSVELPTVVQ